MKKLISRKYFEIWADEQAQNSILKGLLTFFIIINITLIISITTLASRKPLLVSIKEDKTNIINYQNSISESFIKNEVTSVINNFISLRHNWNEKTIENNIKLSTKYISSAFKAKFLNANASNIKIAKKKKITQRFYISKDIEVDLKNKQALLTGDRILIVDGLRATQPMTFKITYKLSKRTINNPEGVYIIKEEMISNLEN